MAIPRNLILFCGLQAAFFVSAPAGAADYSALQKASDWPAMESAALSALQANPADADAAWYLTQSALRLNDEDKQEAAVDAANTCIEAAPKAASCHHALGRLYGVRAQSAGLFSAMRLAPKIKTHFEAAVKLAPLNFTARDDLNSFYLAAPSIAGGGADKAEKNVAEYAALDVAGGKLLDVRLLNAAKKTSEAEAIVLTEVRYADPDQSAAHTSALIGMSAWYLTEKRPADGLRIAAFALSAYPEHATVQLVYGRAKLENGDVEGAIVALEKSLQINPKSGAQYRLGLAYEQNGRKEDAVQKYREFLLNNKPDSSPQAKDAAARLKLIGL